MDAGNIGKMDMEAIRT